MRNKTKWCTLFSFYQEVSFQNVYWERKNQTTLGMVFTILSRSVIPKCFWPRAANWSIHILSRSPTLAVQIMKLHLAALHMPTFQTKQEILMTR
jgi:hypothetical protein